MLVCDALNKEVLAAGPDLAVRRPGRYSPAGLSAPTPRSWTSTATASTTFCWPASGNFYATDDRVGSVVWLRGKADGTFTPVTLLDSVGRVADVRAADFTGTASSTWWSPSSAGTRPGRSSFWRTGRPTGRSRSSCRGSLDTRHGTTHVPVADLNGDGKPDFVAVITPGARDGRRVPERGRGGFRKETIYTAPHPAFGSNGIQLVDLNGDGKLDVLYSNGDTLDPPYLLRPDHGVTWLENRGTYPFTPHRLADCPGAGSPVAADFTGNGRLDVAFVSFLPRSCSAARGRRSSTR